MDATACTPSVIAVAVGDGHRARSGGQVVDLAPRAGASAPTSSTTSTLRKTGTLIRTLAAASAQRLWARGGPDRRPRRRGCRSGPRVSDRRTHSRRGVQRLAEVARRGQGSRSSRRRPDPAIHGIDARVPGAGLIDEAERRSRTFGRRAEPIPRSAISSSSAGPSACPRSRCSTRVDRSRLAGRSPPVEVEVWLKSGASGARRSLRRVDGQARGGGGSADEDSGRYHGQQFARRPERGRDHRAGDRGHGRRRAGADRSRRLLELDGTARRQVGPRRQRARSACSSPSRGPRPTTRVCR